jgi:DNA-binding LacI/PurR family transcriptional regulator
LSVTLSDVAKRAGVSIKTVSRVVNNQGEVSKETRERVLESIQELSYQPNAFARGLVMQRSYTLAIVSWGLDKYSPSRFVMGAEREADEQGYSVLLTIFRRSKTENIDAFLNSLVARQVDGIIWQAPRIGNNQDWINPDRLMRLPPIVLNGLPNPYVNTVSMDNHHGGLIATRHLIEQGWQRIGAITGRAEHIMTSERLRGWQDALREAGREPDFDLVANGDWSGESGARAMQDLLERHPDLDAAFISDDFAAIGAIHAARQAGRQIGQDLGLVGYDGLPESAYYHPPLTTVNQPIFELGRSAVQSLVRRIDARLREDEPAQPELLVIKPELVIRESSIRCAQDNPMTKDTLHV